MYHYMGNPIKDKIALADCIEAALGRDEIKSTGEETEISVKAIRQALENKIIFLSRKQYKTDNETTSLAIGYNLPNMRSEVFELIEDIHNSFKLSKEKIEIRYKNI